jgi:hypothetical protein
MDPQRATLIAHVDTNIVTREQLAALPPVEGTKTFKPVAHIELVETLEKVLADRDIKIEREQFATGLGGIKLFGTLDLNVKGVGASCASLGVRTANDRSMSIQMIAGMRIFVCDNLAFNGELVCINRKHTSKLDLFEELELAVSKYERHFRKLKKEVSRLTRRKLTDPQAKAMIYDVFSAEIMPTRLFRIVGQEYFQPRHKEFEPRTAWSLHNALTEVAKAMPISTRMQATVQIGEYFEKFLGRGLPAPTGGQKAIGQAA